VTIHTGDCFEVMATLDATHTNRHVIRVRTGPQGEDPRCGICGRPVNWTAFGRKDGTVVAFLRHWPER
jgi:hypothetical protein